MLKIKASLLFATLLISANSYAISSTTSSKISGDIAIEDIQAYAASSTKSKKVGVVPAGTQLIEFKTFMKTRPGLATMEKNSWDRAIPFDRGANIEIWEYLNDGFSRIIINGVRYNAKIARSTTECKRFPASPKYCWAKVVEEPEYYEWKLVALKQDAQKFWVLNRIVDGSGIISVKDQGIEKSRVVSTKYVEQPKKEEVKTTEKKDNKQLLSPDLKKNPEEVDSVENTMAKALLLSPEERKKARQEAKKKLKEKLAEEKNGKKVEQTNETTLTKEQMFKQQSIKSIQANITRESTAQTMKTVNKDLAAPATKLELKANQPLDIPAIEYQQ